MTEVHVILMLMSAVLLEALLVRYWRRRCERSERLLLLYVKLSNKENIRIGIKHE